MNWFRSKMNNGVMEGMNSVIQAVKRRAIGYRDWRNLRTMCYLRGSGLCRSITGMTWLLSFISCWTV
ncbi:MAG: transposase [Candidatus Methanomethylophilaceae archaeon]|nr:transposase [Candidatus Methanomethylophilaceae archaeon]